MKQTEQRHVGEGRRRSGGAGAQVHESFGLHDVNGLGVVEPTRHHGDEFVESMFDGVAEAVPVPEANETSFRVDVGMEERDVDVKLKRDGREVRGIKSAQFVRVQDWRVRRVSGTCRCLQQREVKEAVIGSDGGEAARIKAGKLLKLIPFCAEPSLG